MRTTSNRVPVDTRPKPKPTPPRRPTRPASSTSNVSKPVTSSNPKPSTSTPAASSKPSTVRPKPLPVAAPGVNPLNAAVTSAIQGQIKPYQQAGVERDTRYQHDLADQQAVQQTLQDRLKGIAGDLRNSNADALGLAAQRGTASADAMQRNMDFLKNTLGAYVTDGGQSVAAGVQPAAVQSGADAAGNAVGVMAGGAAGMNQLAAQQGANTMAGGERAAQLLNARLADQRSLTQEIARIKATAPLLKRQFGREDAELSMARDELNLNRQQASDAAANNAAQIGLGYAGINAGKDGAAADAAAKAAADAAANAGKYGYKIDKKYDPMLDALFNSVSQQKVPVMGPDGKPTGATGPNPNRMWRQTISALTGMGLSGGQAVLLASKWMPERLSIHGARSPAVIYKILKSGELGFKLSDAVAKQVLMNIGPNAWAQRNAKPPAKPSGFGGAGASGAVKPTVPQSSASKNPQTGEVAPAGMEWIFHMGAWVLVPKHHG